MTRCTLSSTSSNYSLLVRQYMHAPQGLKSSLFHSQSCQTAENGLTHTPTPPHPPELPTHSLKHGHRHTNTLIEIYCILLDLCQHAPWPLCYLLAQGPRGISHFAFCMLLNAGFNLFTVYLRAGLPSNAAF